ncbi:MAG: hypothetical protein MSG64_16720 [Pyrinomonadaceae bacterium MAG19_C2-C3]|nr:hypothetical protein [Pyrinomonadaceae bacterium MAG19_C2-C3]
MRLPPATEAAISRRRPELLTHGVAYAAAALIHEALHIAVPATPTERKAAGGAALTGEAKARNRHGANLKPQEFEKYKCRDCRTWILTAVQDSHHLAGDYHKVRERNRLTREEAAHAMARKKESK